MKGLSAVIDAAAPAILDRLPLGVCMIRQDFTVAYWNATLEAWTGIPRGQIEGSLLTEYYPHLREPKFHRRLLDTLEQGTPAVFSPTFHRHFLPAPSDRADDGGMMIQQTWALPVNLPGDGERAAVVIIEDATKTARQLAELRREKRRLVETQGQMKQHLADLEANRQALLNLMEEAKQARQQAEQAAAELKLKNVELDRARAAAEAATRSKSEFLANMSHEIRTPMTAILGFADVLLEHGNLKNAPSERVEAANTIKRNGEYLLQLINDILDISKIEAGRLEVEDVQCSPFEIVAEVQSLMQVRAAGKGLPLGIEYVGAVPETIHTDPTRLRQILINLIGNALKFTETGSVRLVTRFVEGQRDRGTKGPSDVGELPSASLESSDPGTLGPSLRFDIIDTGIGLTAAQIGRLFQAFTQADNSTTRKFGGTGLGLTISKRLANMLGGDITVESVSGEGSTFSVAVAIGPLDGVKMLDDPQAATVLVTDAGTSGQGNADRLDCRILLVEDGPDNQRLIAAVLRKAGAEVAVAENGKLGFKAALAACDEGNPFDVILMDMQMPVMDGYTAARLLREKGYTRPIIALTAHAMAEDRQRCLDAGCGDYATKPIDRKKLIATIRKHAATEPTCAHA